MTFACFFSGTDTPGLDDTTKCATLDAGDYCNGCEFHICSNHAMDPTASGNGHDPDEHARRPEDE